MCIKYDVALMYYCWKACPIVFGFVLFFNHHTIILLYVIVWWWPKKNELKFSCRKCLHVRVYFRSGNWSFGQIARFHHVLYVTQCCSTVLVWDESDVHLKNRMVQILVSCLKLLLQLLLATLGLRFVDYMIFTHQDFHCLWWEYRGQLQYGYTTS